MLIRLDELVMASSAFRARLLALFLALLESSAICGGLFCGCCSGLMFASMLCILFRVCADIANSFEAQFLPGFFGSLFSPLSFRLLFQFQCYRQRFGLRVRYFTLNGICGRKDADFISASIIDATAFKSNWKITY